MKTLIALENFISTYDPDNGVSFKSYYDEHKLQLYGEANQFTLRLNTESPGDCNLPLTLELIKSRNEYYTKWRILAEKGFNLPPLKDKN